MQGIGLMHLAQSTDCAALLTIKHLNKIYVIIYMRHNVLDHLLVL